MNVDRIQPTRLWPAQTANAAGQRVDFTLSSPAEPDGLEPSALRGNVPQVGSLQGVLSADENRAIDALFGSPKGVYTPNGEVQQHARPLGDRFDARA